MSGICSKHQGYDPRCRICNAIAPTPADLYLQDLLERFQATGKRLHETEVLAIDLIDTLDRVLKFATPAALGAEIDLHIAADLLGGARERLGVAIAWQNQRQAEILAQEQTHREQLERLFPGLKRDKHD